MIKNILLIFCTPFELCVGSDNFLAIVRINFLSIINYFEIRFVWTPVEHTLTKEW